MRQVTASKLSLALACQHPWTSGVEWKETTSTSGRLGNAIHAMAERWVRDGAANVDGVALEFSLQPAQIKRLEQTFTQLRGWLATHDTSTWMVERPFAFNPATGVARVLPGKSHRDYSAATEDEICGTADVVDFGDHLVVRDYKSGVWVDHPSDSAQMRFLALAASRFLGRSHVTAEIVRTMPDGIHPIPHTFDVLDMAMVENELHDLHQRLRKPMGPTPSVAACRFCPIRHACPENLFAEKEQAVIHE